MLLTHKATMFKTW